LDKAGKACQEQTLQLIGSILKRGRKYNVLNMAPDVYAKLASTKLVSIGYPSIYETK
jgi:hypothetical protein